MEIRAWGRAVSQLDAAYLAFVETHDCCVSQLGECKGDVAARHVRKVQHARVHCRTVPPCFTHHTTEWHQHGRVRPMTNPEALELCGGATDSLNTEWKSAARWSANQSQALPGS